MVGASLALLNTGCSSTFGCDPPSKKFTMDEDLTQADVANIVSDWGLSDPGEIDCETACRYKFRIVDGWETNDVDSCTHDVDADATEDPAGHVTCAGTAIEYFCEGRRPLGWVARPATSASSLVEQLVALATLEAVSVRSFEQLAERLEGRGAPAALVRRCRSAAGDEHRHTEAVLELARARGWSGELDLDARDDPAPVALLDEALHNADEGCVAETWAAVIAHVRADRAPAADVRACYARIAADETRHAQLAWDLHAWFRTRLAAPDRARVEARRARALQALPRRAARLAASVSPALAATTPREAAWLAGEFASRLPRAA